MEPLNHVLGMFAYNFVVIVQVIVLSSNLVNLNGDRKN